MENGLPVSCGGASTTIPIAEKVYPTAEKIEFIPAEGFVAESRIGENTLYGYEFYGEGNKFRVTWKTGDVTEVKEYVYTNNDDEWGFVNNDGDDEEWFWTSVQLDKRVAKGTADYTGKAAVDTEYGEMKLPITVKVSAEMYLAEVEYKAYSYTGKNIKPKAVVKYYDGKKIKTMPSKWYTVKYKKHKAIGGYDDLTVKIKAKYQKKYGAELGGYWEILPKTPTIKKATAGKAGTGSITVTWTKFSKSAQKGIDGFYVQACTDKTFNDWKTFTEVEAAKGASKATISGLTPGKTYFVCVRSYKALKGHDGSPWASKPSKVKKVKVPLKK